MTPADRLAHARLERRIQELERELRNVPARFAVPSSITLYAIEVQGGNTLATVGGNNITGVIYNASANTVPITTPINGATYANGLGYGQLLNNTWAVTGGKVWLRFKSIATAMNFVATGGIVICSQTTATVDAGGTTTVYDIIRSA